MSPVSSGAGPWRLLFLLSAIGFALIGGTLISLSVYLPGLQRHFGWSETAMGSLPVALLIGMSIGNLLVGRMIARYGINKVLVGGVVVSAIGWGGASQASTLPHFLIAMLLAGGGTGMATIVPGMAAITRSFDARRGLAIGVFLGACALAGSIVPLLSAALIGAWGWRAAFLIMGIAIATLCLPLAWSVRTSGEREEVATVGASGPCARKVAKWPVYWLLTLALTISQLCMNAILFNLVAMLLRRGFLQETAVTIFSAANLMALPGLFIGGVLADRHGARVALPLVLLMQALGTLCLLGVGGPRFAGGGVAMAGFILLWGLSGGLPSQIGPLRLAELIGTRAFATMLGATFTISGLVGALAPLMTGVLYERSGGYALPVAACGGALVVAALLTLAMPSNAKARRLVQAF